MGLSIVLRSKPQALTVLFATLFVFTPLCHSVAYGQSFNQPNQLNELQFPGSGSCSNSLQECINSAPNGATIRISSGIHTASILIERPISLIGAGADSTTLQAEANKRVLHIKGSAINSAVSIAHLTISGGSANGSANHDQLGGGILIEEGATPQLHDLIVRDNFARSYGGGIAIVSTEQAVIAEISIRNSVIRNNTTDGTGGGLCSNADHTTIESTHIDGNHAKHGGGILVNGAFTMSNLQITGNQADEFGGGVYGGHDSKMEAILSTLSNSHFEKNSAGYQGGGAFVFNTILDHDHFQQNQVSIENQMSGGGALAASSVVTVSKSIFLENSAPDGGGIAGVGGKIWVNNSLFIDNLGRGAQTGAAFSLVNASPTTRSYLTHLTIVHRSDTNRSAAIKTGDGEVRLMNSIVVNHTTALYNSNGRMLEQNNLYFDNSQNIAGDTIRSSNSVYADPFFVDPNSLNFHLRTDSAAIDAGIEVDIMDDFDGQSRPLGGAPDIGFDEVGNTFGGDPQPTPTPQPTPEPQPTPDPQPTPEPVTREMGYGIFLPLVVR